MMHAFSPDYRPDGYSEWTREEKWAYTDEQVRSFCAAMSKWGYEGEEVAETMWNHWFDEGEGTFRACALKGIKCGHCVECCK